MARCCLSFIAGAALISLLPALPAEALRYALIPLLPFAALPRRVRPLAAALAGALLYWSIAVAVLADRLPRPESGNDFNFEAYIIDFPKERKGRLTFVAAPIAASLPRRVRLSWYDAEQRPALGERWRLQARLRRPRGSANPGGFDYAGWLHRERIGADGYVRRGERAAAADDGFGSLRRHAVARVQSRLPAGDARAALLAVAVGARHEIADAAWQRYAVTGTSHLMAVSGLHVGLAAVAAGYAGWGLLGVFGVCRNLRDAASLVAVPVAGLYAALAGFAVPAQRALLMTVIAVVLLLARRVPSPLRSLVLVAVVVLIADPLALLAPGFLLSFGAVAVLLLTLCRHAGRQRRGLAARCRRAVAELGAVQIALLLGLFPLTAALFDRVAWLAPLVNVVVVPVFSLVTVPAALAGLALDGPLQVAGDALLTVAWHSLRGIHGLIDAAAALPGAAVTLAEPTGPARLVFLLPLCGLLPAGCPGRRLGWLALAWAIQFRPAAPPAGCVDVHTLDVGQGLAQVVQTPRHALLYDTGPAWRASTSAERIVLPFLAARGIRRLDRVVVSHADSDHAGGVAAIAGRWTAVDVLAGEPLAVPVEQRPCRRGQGFAWDGIGFRILHPAGQATGNDASCVLEIAAGRHRIVLTGDIEARSERLLVERGDLRPAVLVAVPHHGSRTSSTAAFVAELAPAVAVVSAGFANRWGFPKPDVVNRWRAAGAEVVTTAATGAVQHRLCRDRGLETLSRYRRDARRYWHDLDR